MTSNPLGRPPHDVMSPDGNLARFLEHQARLRPDECAFVFPHRTRIGWSDDIVTFGALDNEGRRFGAALRAGGLAPGDHVLVLVPPSRSLYVALVGVACAGGIAVFVDPWMPRARIDQALATVKPRVFIGVARAHLLRLVSPQLRAVQRHIVVTEPGLLATLMPGERLVDLLDRTPEPMPLADVPGNDPCIVSFTSGTTGTPKGAVRTHRLLAAQGDALDHAFPRQPGDVDLTSLPVFALLAVSQGVPSVFAAVRDGDVSRFDAMEVCAQLQRHRVTSIGGAPMFLLELARAIKDKQVSLPLVRSVTVGGAPTGPHLLRVLIDAFPDAAVKVLYGSTEAEPVASEDARALLHLAGRGCCVGRPHPGIEVRVVRADLPRDCTVARIDDVVVDVGEVGEVVVFGPVVVERYIDARDAKHTKIVDAAGRLWHRMGDLAHQDADGRLWLRGRLGEEVRTAEGTMYPLDVEPTAEALDGVARAGLVAVDDRPVLAVSPARGQRRADVVARVRDALDHDGLHLHVVAVKRIPVDKRHRSRVDRPTLRAMVSLQ